MVDTVSGDRGGIVYAMISKINMQRGRSVREF